MPYGAVFLDSLNPPALSSKFVMHYGNDKRLIAAANFPSTGQRLTTQLVQLNQALVKAFFATSTTNSGSRIVQGLRAFPDTQSTALTFQFGGIIGRILYPFGVSFLLPIFVIVLVKEKEDRM